MIPTIGMVTLTDRFIMDVTIHSSVSQTTPPPMMITTPGIAATKKIKLSFLQMCVTL